MHKDPTEFRKRFAAWKGGKKPYLNGRPEPIQRIDNSEADFAQRLRSKWRQEVWDWEGTGKAATHKLSSADNIIYPNVLTTKGGGLIDFTHPMWQGVVDPYLRAIRNKDYVPMRTEGDAIWTGPNYKLYYPSFENGLPKYKDGLPVYRGGKLVLNNYTNAEFNDDGTFTDDTTRVFDDFYVTPSGVKTKYGSYTDKNWDRYKQQEQFFKTHDQQTGKLKYEPGLEIVSPEFDLLTGIRPLMPTINGLDRKTYYVAREMNKGLKKNPILKSYNSNSSYLDTGGNVLQYLDYINSLFPNSKVKDVVYHSTWAKPFEQFDPGKIKRGYGFYFSPVENHLPFDRMVYSRVNILNPLEIFPNKNRNLDVSGLWKKDLTEQAIKNGLHDGVIGVSNMRNPGEPEIVALNPNQIHILGSKRDVEGFRRFVSSRKKR